MRGWNSGEREPVLELPDIPHWNLARTWLDVIRMKLLRGLGAAVVWLLATVVVILAAVLCITLVLLPLGLPLMALGLRMYGYGVQLMVPRAPEVKRGIRKGLGLRAHGSVAGDVKRAGKRGKKSSRKLRKKGGGLADDAGKSVGRGRKKLAGVFHS
jgi:hypothetical protein